MRNTSTRADLQAEGGGFLARAAMFAALAGLVHTTWRACHSTHRRRLTSRPEAPPDRLQVWEGEGGQNQMPGQPASE